MAGVLAGFACWCAGQREHVGGGGVGDDVAVLAGSDFPDGVAGEVAAGPVRHGPAGRVPGDVGVQAVQGAGEQAGGAAVAQAHALDDGVAQGGEADAARRYADAGGVVRAEQPQAGLEGDGGQQFL
jgi:hypothetical protein